MPMEKVAFEFPDPDRDTSKDIKMKEDGSAEIVIEGRRDPFADVDDKKADDKPASKKKADEDDIDIEVVDDTPKKDRGKKPSAPPDELTDEELESYSEKVKKRLQHFSKGYHDQRRAAEQAAREKAELEAMAARLVEENKKLKGTVGQNQQAMLEQAKKMAERELEEAKAKFKSAYDAGESDAVVAAQEELTAAKMKAERVNNLKLPALQESESEVQHQPSAPAVDERAVKWQQDNSWFGQDDEMTSFALGLHQKLVKQGVNPRSDDYYEKINARMRQVFPDAFDDVEEDEPEETKPRRKTNVVAPATRSTAPKKIVLTQTQVALAKRLGVPLEEYAKQVAMEMRKQNG
jgi:uncharacterized protein (UPF0303 family)